MGLVGWIPRDASFDTPPLGATALAAPPRSCGGVALEGRGDRDGSGGERGRLYGVGQRPVGELTLYPQTRRRNRGLRVYGGVCALKYGYWTSFQSGWCTWFNLIINNILNSFVLSLEHSYLATW